MKLDDFLAKCLRCGEQLGIDEMGCDTCYKCDAEFRENGDYEASADLAIRRMDEQDNRVLIIPKKKLEELKLLIQGSTPKLEDP